MNSIFVGSEYAYLLNKRNKLEEVCYSWGMDSNINGIDLYVTDKKNEKLKDKKSFMSWYSTEEYFIRVEETNKGKYHDLRSMISLLGINETQKLIFKWEKYINNSFKSLKDEKLVTIKKRKLSL